MSEGSYPVSYRNKPRNRGYHNTRTGYQGSDWLKLLEGHPEPEDRIIRRMVRGSKVPIAKRRRKALLTLTAKGIGKALSRHNDLIKVAEQLIEFLPNKGKNPLYIHDDTWELCFKYSACNQMPVGFAQKISSSCTGIGPDCLSGQAITQTQSYGLGSPVFADRNNVTYHTKISSLDRATHVRGFTRVKRFNEVVPSPDVIVQPVRFTVPSLPRTFVETLDPELLPISQPAGTPVAVPYRLQPDRRTHRWRDPLQQRQAANWPIYRGIGNTQPAPGTVPDTDTAPNVGIDPVTGLPVNTTPAVPTAPGLVVNPATGIDPITGHPNPSPTRGPVMVVDVSPSGGARSRSPSVVRPHQASRPPKNTKEKKLVLGATGGVSAVINLVTESADFVNALHKGLPPKYRAPRVKQTDPRTGKSYTSAPSPYDKARYIYKNIEHMHWGTAVREVIANQAEDALIGRLGRVQQRANRKVGKYARIQIGLGPAI